MKAESSLSCVVFPSQVFLGKIFLTPGINLGSQSSHIRTYAPHCNFWVKELQGNELIKNHHKVLAKSKAKKGENSFAMSFKMYKKCKKCCSSGEIASVQAGSFLLDGGTCAEEMLLPRVRLEILRDVFLLISHTPKFKFFCFIIAFVVVAVVKGFV